MLRVGNLQRSIDFYTHGLGMQVLRTSENPDYGYSLAFVGFDGGNPGQAAKGRVDVDVTGEGVDRASALRVEPRDERDRGGRTQHAARPP